MQARNCRERILALKQWRADKGYTVEFCVELCGGVPSDSTVSKVFYKGSENKTFRETTIAAIELKCLGQVYEPNIKIPVEDVIRAQAESAKETRLLRHTIEKQAHLIRGLVSVTIISLVFFGGIALYDFFSHSTGFWNTNGYLIWIAKVAFLMCVTIIIGRWLFVLRKIKAKFEAEERDITEGYA